MSVSNYKITDDTLRVFVLKSQLAYNSDMLQKPHITIVGSGLVGLSAALALEKTGFQVTVLSQSSLQPCIDDQRPISVSLTTQRFLDNIELWTACRFQAAPIESVHASEAGVFGALRLHAAEIQSDALGYVLPFYHLNQVLSEQVARSAIDFHVIDDICDIKEHEDVSLTIKVAGHTEHRQSDWLIAADGRSSRCRDLLNIEAITKAHGDVAHTAIITCDQPHQHQAFERFSQDGIWAVLPMWKPNQYRLVWTTQGQADQAPDLNVWLARFQAVFQGYLAGIQSLDYTGTYPLQTVIATQQATTRCVLLGDAAHRLYPISAQGFNLSIRDVAGLVDILKGQQPLASYVQQRQHDQRQVACFTELLEQVFGLQLPGFRGCRGAALGIIDTLPPVKRYLINQLLGRQGMQPSLLLSDQ